MTGRSAWKRIQMILGRRWCLRRPGSAASAAGDAAAGEASFRVCKICHQIGEGARNFVGPDSTASSAARRARVPGYNYSDANKNSGVTWDEATLTRYLQTPTRGRAGHEDGLPGLQADEDDVANVIAYLKQFGPDGKKQ